MKKEENKKEKSTKILSIKRRVVEISNKLKVEKTGKNTFAKYEYLTPEDIMRKLNPLLEEYNLITIFNMDEHPTKENKFIGKLIVEDCDSEEKLRYRFIIPFNEVKGASAGQAMGATMTYCKRYSLMNAFNIAGDDDLDKVIDGKNVKEAKTQNVKLTVAEVIKRIKTCKTKEDIKKWEGWIDLEKTFTEMQKNVIKRNIEEQSKVCE